MKSIYGIIRVNIAVNLGNYRKMPHYTIHIVSAFCVYEVLSGVSRKYDPQIIDILVHTSIVILILLIFSISPEEFSLLGYELNVFLASSTC